MGLITDAVITRREDDQPIQLTHIPDGKGDVVHLVEIATIRISRRWGEEIDHGAHRLAGVSLVVVICQQRTTDALKFVRNDPVVPL